MEKVVDSPIIWDGVYYASNGDAHIIPEVWEVCPKCEGAGRLANPAFNGMTADELDPVDREEFYKNYFAGVYDIMCFQCEGRTTVRAHDVSVLSPDIRAEYDAELESARLRAAQDAAWERAEKRGGC